MEELFDGPFDGSYIQTSGRPSTFIVNIVDYAYAPMLRNYPGTKYVRHSSDGLLYWIYSEWDRSPRDAQHPDPDA